MVFLVCANFRGGCANASQLRPVTTSNMCEVAHNHSYTLVRNKGFGFASSPEAVAPRQNAAAICCHVLLTCPCAASPSAPRSKAIVEAVWTSRVACTMPWKEKNRRFFYENGLEQVSSAFLKKVCVASVTRKKFV